MLLECWLIVHARVDFTLIFCCMIAWPNEMTRCAYTTVSAVCSCMFLCVPVRREFRVLVHILRYDSCALSVSFVVFILCALCMYTCELHARVDFSFDVSARLHAAYLHDI